MRGTFLGVLRNTSLYLAAVAAAVVPFIPSSQKAVAFAGGDGTPSNPYEITDCAELQDMENDLAAHYVLTASIDCTSTAYTPVGDNATPFTGTFDGQHNVITNLTVATAGLYVGVFGYTNNATISNVRIEDSSFSGQSTVGSIVGYAGGSTLSYISADTVVTSATNDVVGGLVGGLGGSTLSYSYAENVDVSGAGQQIGGLVGWVVGPSSLTNSYVEGEVTGDNVVGGVAGQLGVGPAILSNTYADVVFGGLAGSDVIGVVEMGGMPSNNFMASAPYLSNNTQTPLNLWDFTNVWYVRSANYPGLRPNVTLSMLCNAPSSTNTSITASCTSYPANLQTTLTWDIEYKPDLKSDWITRPDQVADVFSDTINGLVPGTDFTVRFRHTSVLGTSPWGTVSVSTTGPSDSDGDNVSNLDESYAPNAGDANNDSMFDYMQPEVTSALNTSTGSYVVLVTSCSDNFNVMLGMESSGSQADQYFDYPHGIVGFVTRGCSVGGTAQIDLFFYDTADDMVLRKTTSDGYVTVPATFRRLNFAGHDLTQATYEIVDGGVLDDDGIADGNIVDPVGLASAVLSSPNTGFAR